jgi:hypothetical protein
MFCSCTNVIPKRYWQHVATKAKIQNALELAYYIDMFEQEINTGNEIDLVIEVNSTSGTE